MNAKHLQLALAVTNQGKKLTSKIFRDECQAALSTQEVGPLESLAQQSRPLPVGKKITNQNQPLQRTKQIAKNLEMDKISKFSFNVGSHHYYETIQKPCTPSPSWIAFI